MEEHETTQTQKQTLILMYYIHMCVYMYIIYKLACVWISEEKVEERNEENDKEKDWNKIKEMEEKEDK